VLDVVLDENVYVHALTAGCTDHPFDRQAALVLLYLQKKHRWLFTYAVEEAYRKQFSNNVCQGALSSQLMTSLNDVLVDQRRSYFIVNPEIVQGSYHHKDQHVVAAAASVAGSYLVTTDMRLKKALDREGIPTRYSFEILDLNGAEQLLR